MYLHLGKGGLPEVAVPGLVLHLTGTDCMMSMERLSGHA